MEPSITTRELPAAVTGEPYAAAVVSDGTAPVRYSIDGGSLPPGTALDPDSGRISGATEQDGTWSFTVVASNAAGSDRRELSITSGTLPSILTTELPPAVLGEPYRAQVDVAGTDPVAVTISVGSLPAGLRLDDDGRAIVGVPSSAGVASFTLRATNSAGTSTRAFGLAVGTRPTITTETLPPAPAGEAYAAAFATSGTAPRSVRLVTGLLPAGLTLTADGVLSGSTETAGTFVLDVAVSNAFGEASRKIGLVVAPAALASLDVRVDRTDVLSGTTVRLASRGADRFGNDLGDLTTATTFSSDIASDVVAGPDVTVTAPGRRHLTGAVGQVRASVAVEVRQIAGPPPVGGPGRADPGDGDVGGEARGGDGPLTGGDGSTDGTLPQVGSTVTPDVLVLGIASLMLGIAMVVWPRAADHRRER